MIIKRFATLALGVALFAAACGGAATPAPATKAPATAAPATAAPATAAPATAAPATAAPGTAAPSGGALEGTIKISGSSTVIPITSAVQEAFNEINPGVSISVDGPGTGPGFAAFCAGDTDISDASRAIKPTGEADVCAQNGVKYIELKIALDGISVLTAKSNDTVDCLSFNDLYALIGPESGPTDKTGAAQTPFTNWKQAQALATELGSTTVFPDAPLTITAPGEESGTYDFFVSTVLTPIAVKRGLPADNQKARPDYQSSPDDNAIITGVAGTPDNNATLGWVGFAYAEENADKVKTLKVDGGKGCVEDSAATIADGSYPISRDLFLYVNTDKADANPALQAFVDYYMAEGTIDAALKVAPYIPLPAADLAASQAAWANR